MYDLTPPNMHAQFNSINKSNQSIKLSVNINDKSKSQKAFSEYTYNNIIIFKYSIDIKKSEFSLNIFLENNYESHFNKTIVGSFIYDYSIKYSISQINIKAKRKPSLDSLVYGFLQKDFIYSFYKKDSQFNKYKTTFKLPKQYSSLLNSINFLKELVSEPSNIIYPTSFVKRSINQINKKQVNIKTLNKNNIKKIGLNCLLAVSQGSQREPRVMEFVKKKYKK